MYTGHLPFSTKKPIWSRLKINYVNKYLPKQFHEFTSKFLKFNSENRGDYIDLIEIIICNSLESPFKVESKYPEYKHSMFIKNDNSIPGGYMSSF